MGLYHELQELWKDPRKNIGSLYKERLISWRKEPNIIRIERPTRLDRAHTAGYKAKKGISVVRICVARGGRKREQRKSGRRSHTMRRQKIVGMSYQLIAEQRVQRKFTNLEVLNSYPVGKDGKQAWYEVILVDPMAPEIQADKNLKWICQKKHRHRVLRGKTSAGQKSRGLRRKGTGAEKLRPSRRAHNRLSK